MYLLKWNPDHILRLNNMGIITVGGTIEIPSGVLLYSNLHVGVWKGNKIKSVRIFIPTATATITYDTDTNTNLTVSVPYSNLAEYTYNGTDILLLINEISPLDNNTKTAMQDMDDNYSMIQSYPYSATNYNLDNLSQYSDLSGNNAFILFTNTSEENKLDKSLVIRGYVFGDYTNAFSLMTPVIDLELSADSINFNYVYINTLKRYYFVRGVSSISKDLTRFSFEEDVLMTFKSLIKNQYAIVSRNEYTYNKYLDDDRRSLKNEPKISYTEYTNTELSAQPSATTGYFYVLSVVK